MDDLISRQAAIDVVGRWFKKIGLNGDICLDAIVSLPSAEPVIIHCKDCKYYDGRPCGVVDYYNTESDFCSRAERRTDERFDKQTEGD